MNILQQIFSLVGNRAILLPIPLGIKAPAFHGWQQVTFADTQVPAYQRRLQDCISAGGNIGILLGNTLAAIDFDTDTAMTTFLDANPAFANTLQTKGKRGCQFWFKVAGDYPERVHFMKDIGEWRGGKCQSVIYGAHPSGCRYQWQVTKPVMTYSFSAINWGTIHLPWMEKAAPVYQPYLVTDHATENRILSYLDAVPPAITGCGGNTLTFHLACTLVNGFALSRDQARRYLDIYNQRCDPMWTSRELDQKLDSAITRQHAKPKGYLLTTEETTKPRGSLTNNITCRICNDSNNVHWVESIQWSLCSTCRACARELWKAGVIKFKATDPVNSRRLHTKNQVKIARFGSIHVNMFGVST
jgi:hypothetical protein